VEGAGRGARQVVPPVVAGRALVRRRGQISIF
jgi:hypothetical protein